MCVVMYLQRNVVTVSIDLYMYLGSIKNNFIKPYQSQIGNLTTLPLKNFIACNVQLTDNGSICYDVVN